MNRSRAFLALVLAFSCGLFPLSGHSATTFVDFGAKTHWKYLDDGKEPVEGWRQPSLDDSAWKSGPAPLGYNAPQVNTEVGFGGSSSARAMTTYFRRGFQVESVEGIEKLVLVLCVDDGAMVYLNGEEVIRFNLPRKTGSTTKALRDIHGSEEKSYHRHELPVPLLQAGKNVLAVEVHQSSAESDDLFFDLILRGYRAGEDLGTARVAPDSSKVVRAYREKHYLGMILAKAYEKLNRPDKAREQVEAALRIEPGEFLATLSLSVLAMKESDGGAALRRAGTLIEKAASLMKRPPPLDQWKNLHVVRGVYLALNGQAEAAEDLLEAVLERDKDNEAAREALEVLRS